MTAPGPTILVVEDDPATRALLAHVLGGAGFRVVEAPAAAAAAELVGSARPDLVLLDVGLPDRDGFDLLADLRRTRDLPVIMLTGAGREEQRIAGLRRGADDYVVKPFSPGELVARIETVLRRTRRAVADPAGDAGLVVDAAAREVRVEGRLVELTAKEFDLLAFLVRSPRQAFTRDDLLRHVWSSSAEWQDDATVTEHVRRLRRKLEEHPDRPRWIVTVRGVGYRFEP